jgi:membrane fusion protein (multidrug efflux system)
MGLNKKNLIRLGSVVGILILGFFIMFVLASTEKHSNKRDVETEVRLVETQSVYFEDLALEIEGNGVIESKKTLNVISEANGPVLFAKNDLKDGTFVREGDLIIEIDAREVENSLYTMRSEFLNTLAQVLPDIKVEDPKAYEKWYIYFIDIDIHQITPELPDISGSQEKIKLSTRSVFSKYYAVKNQEILLSKYKITAPFTGYIKSNGVVEGSFVSKGSHLFTLSDAVNVEIAVPLLIGEVNLINFSNPPTVKIFPDNHQEEVVYGRIYRKETLLNRNSQTLNVYVSFTNGNLNSFFLPGNYVKVKIEGMMFKNVAKIPRHVLDNEQFVYTMEDGKLARRKVDLVAIQGNDAVIKYAGNDDMNIITTILQKPLIGMPVKSANESIELKEEIPDLNNSEELSKAN